MSAEKKIEPKDSLNVDSAAKPSSVGEESTRPVKSEQVSGSDGKVIDKTSNESVQTEAASKSPIDKAQVGLSLNFYYMRSTPFIYKYVVITFKVYNHDLSGILEDLKFWNYLGESKK